MSKPQIGKYISLNINVTRLGFRFQGSVFHVYREHQNYTKEGLSFIGSTNRNEKDKRDIKKIVDAFR